MSTYKSYGTVKSTPSRRSRKNLRQEVFMFNKRAARLKRKEARLARKGAV